VKDTVVGPDTLLELLISANAACDRVLPNRGLHGLATPDDVSRKSNGYRDELHAALSLLMCASERAIAKEKSDMRYATAASSS
jgi:hypothetical protein